MHGSGGNSSGRSKVVAVAVAAAAAAALAAAAESSTSVMTTASAPTKSNNSSSAAATAAPPSATASLQTTPQKSGERPKTEDFLTFLCLRGTNLLPPELDFFNKASVVQRSGANNESGSEDSSSDDEKVTNYVDPNHIFPAVFQVAALFAGI
jgi:hypothetical protein